MYLDLYHDVYSQYADLGVIVYQTNWAGLLDLFNILKKLCLGYLSNAYNDQIIRRCTSKH